jgi:hypothetical protein
VEEKRKPNPKVDDDLDLQKKGIETDLSNSHYNFPEPLQFCSMPQFSYFNHSQYIKQSKLFSCQTPRILETGPGGKVRINCPEEEKLQFAGDHNRIINSLDVDRNIQPMENNRIEEPQFHFRTAIAR